jgi:hypothetical protein
MRPPKKAAARSMTASGGTEVRWKYFIARYRARVGGRSRYSWSYS